MAYWNDIHAHPGKSKNIVLGEIFDTSHDIIDWVKKEEKKIEKRHTWVKTLRAIIHFIFMTSIIFLILLLISNWSAYSAFARALINPEKLQEEQTMMQESIAQTEITETSLEEINMRQARKQRIMRKNLEKSQAVTQDLGVDYFNQDVPQVSLSINIAPYEDRIIIPRIGENIPLVNVEHHDADSSNEWHKIFMKELEKGIVKYPGSADPGERGNSFIFGHSSNYPWAPGEYNDVFALLNELHAGDEIIVYFHQKKFTYVVREKMVVKPGHVSSIGGNESAARMTLMTCWPLGTTLNRLLVVTELKEETPTL